MIEDSLLEFRSRQYVLEDIGLTATEVSNLDEDTKSSIADYILQIKDDMRYNYMKYFRPMQHQIRFFNMRTKRKGLIAANRSGKTVSTCMEVAYHLTGKYPDWWKGHRFKGNIIVVAAGTSWQQVALGVQNELLGTSDASHKAQIGTGSIPRCDIDIKSIKRQRESAKEVRVKNICGQDSILLFRNYSQDSNDVQGFNSHLILIDEQPPDKFYAELTARTMNKSGRVICSFTPLLGFSNLVSNFWDRVSGYDHVRVGWKDIPEHDLWGHPFLLNEDRDLMLKDMPSHEIKPRTEGIPMRGLGQVFTINPIPTYKTGSIHFPYDSYHKLISIDLAAAKDNTVITIAYWDPTKEILYIDHQHVRDPGPQSAYTSWKPILEKAGNRDVPIVLPADANQKGRYTESAGSIRSMLEQDGFNVCEKSINAKFDMGDGAANTISYGISQMNIRMAQGQLFINEDCRVLLKEMNDYYFDDKGNYKGKNDSIDSARYALLGCILGWAKPINFDRHASNQKFKDQLAFYKKAKQLNKPIWKRSIRI